jgi:hypothetical protein
MRPRMTTRRWMFVIAGVALAVALCIQLCCRYERDVIARIAMSWREHAGLHERELAICLDGVRLATLYPRHARGETLAMQGTLDCYEIPLSRFRPLESWEDEAEHHRKRLRELRVMEAQFEARRRAVERYLIFR